MIIKDLLIYNRFETQEEITFRKVKKLKGSFKFVYFEYSNPTSKPVRKMTEDKNKILTLWLREELNSSLYMKYGNFDKCVYPALCEVDKIYKNHNINKNIWKSLWK